jgi:hypothetical protein
MLTIFLVGNSQPPDYLYIKVEEMKQVILVTNHLKFYYLLTQFLYESKVDFNLIRFNHEEFADFDFDFYLFLTDTQTIILDCNDSYINQTHKGEDKFNEEMRLFYENYQRLISHTRKTQQQLLIISNQEMLLSYRYFDAKIPRVHYFTKPINPQKFIQEIERLTEQ